MEIKIIGTPEDIAKLLQAIRGSQEQIEKIKVDKSQVISNGFKQQGITLE